MHNIRIMMAALVTIVVMLFYVFILCWFHITLHDLIVEYLDIRYSDIIPFLEEKELMVSAVFINGMVLPITILVIRSLGGKIDTLDEHLTVTHH